jgi:hypothetical protein
VGRVDGAGASSVFCSHFQPPERNRAEMVAKILEMRPFHAVLRSEKTLGGK